MSYGQNVRTRREGAKEGIFGRKRRTASYLSVVACLALINVFLHIGFAHKPAFVTHVNLECIGLIKQALFEEIGRAVCNDAIALHLSEP